MKVLIVGSGGREHALAWKLAQSPAITQLYALPGNAGIAQQARCVPGDVENLEGLAAFAQREGIDLTVVGPEAPLIAGLADVLAARGLAVFGPTAEAAIIEGSKVFAKHLFRKYGIPTAQFETFDDPAEAEAYLRRQGAPIVVKADGLAAGKGSIVCRDLETAFRAVDQIMRERIFGDAGRQVVIEECLTGQEASIKVFTDGETVVPLVPSQDHKPVYDNDEGPNTGGMGCYSPVPAVSEELFTTIVETILKPTVWALAEEGRPYRGVLYGGLILTAEGPKVLEYNCRFGDPETQVVLPRLEGDLLEILQATVEGRLNEVEVRWSERKAVCVVMASGGYPGPYEKGKVITGLDQVAQLEDVVVFHAGTARREGEWVTNGGRVLGVTAMGDDFPSTIERAYAAVRRIHFEGVHFRRDIARRALQAVVRE
ncbi:MAG TPA: phosphoribosylamine--glycine ligase [Armatimonadetes bacterium]|nr:phosphoribosylamine--glycine ligase [Armatimonadota bacterium]